MKLLTYFVIFLTSIMPLNIKAEEIYRSPSTDNKTKAKYAVIIDHDSGNILYEKNAHIPTAPSSMSKLMTCYLVFEKLRDKSLSLDDELLISQNAWSKQGSKMFVMIGSKVKISDLLLGMIIQSGNDATIALAEGVGGSEASFAELLNEKAKILGLNNSHFVNATGWPDEGQQMSVYDLAKLSSRLISDFPEYYHYFSQKEFEYNNIKQYNRNSLLTKSNFLVDGLKTGRTDIAGYGIAVSAKKGDRRLIVVVNGLNSDKERVDEVNQLLTYGFYHFSQVLIAKSGQNLKEVKLLGGEEKTISLRSQDNILFTVANDKLTKLKVSLSYNEPLIAPIQKGEVIGKLLLHGLEDNPTEIAIKADKDYPLASLWKRGFRYIFGE
jgi:D-alanyl-D-alanine carboxypeptidase (penicillin-binding protein 5/6)